MDTDELKVIIEKHTAWLRDDPDGKKWSCKLGEDLRDANLSGADLREANLRGANLRRADLSRADLSRADLSDADLRGADLRGADLSDADLRGADLSDADLREADLREANLREADLSVADLREADLREANLSGAKGPLSARAFMAQFERDDLGWIVYKRIGNTQYAAPATWVIEPGAFIEEVVNPLPTLDCACGVNFGTRQWCDNNYCDAVLWRCRIRYEDGPDIVVPYNTDGKARCGRLELVEVVE